MNRRKVLGWILALVGLAVLAWLVWLLLSYFFGPKSPDGGNDSWIPPTFFPVGSAGITPTAGNQGAGTTTDVGVRRTVPKLRQLSDVPTAGMVAFRRTEGAAGFRAKATIFRWIERATGNIYETRDDNTTETRVSNTTITGVQEAFFSDDGQTVVARYLLPDNDTIETLVGQIKAVTETTSNGYVYSDSKLVTRYLEPNIVEAGDAPEAGKFYTVTRRDGGATVSLNQYATGTPTAIFQSPLSQWIVRWASTTLALQTKADANAPGFLFRADGGETEKIIDNRSGLTVSINPAGTRALFSETVGNDLHLWVKNLTDGSERLLELRTLPEKCAWSPTEETTVYCGAPDFYVRGAYPTNWYQGRFSFDDNIWKINVDTEKYKILHDTRTGAETFDVWKPMVSPSGRHLLFLNKRDLTLWALDVSSGGPVEDTAAAAPETAATGTPAVTP